MAQRKGKVMQRDSLVHVAATGGYGSVFEVDDKGVCEVGLIDPCADDYSLRVPAHALIEIESVGRDQLDELLDALALFHLGVRHGIRTAKSFELFVGKNEEAALELWFSSGIAAPKRLAELDEPSERALLGALAGLDLDPWLHGGRSAAGQDVSLEGWSWSLELIGGGKGSSGFGRGVAPAGLAALCVTLTELGVPIRWEGGAAGPVAVDSERAETATRR